MGLLGALADGLASLLAPRRCAVCRADLPAARARAGAGPWRGLLCAGCRRGLELVAAACPSCGLSRGPYAAPAPRCPACRNQPAGGVRSTASLLRYRRTTRRLLHRLKYSGRDDLAAPLGADLGARVLALGAAQGRPPPDLVVHVPMHRWRRWRRGFDQAERLAAAVARALARPHAAALRRARATRALHGVPRDLRAAVVAGAFVVDDPTLVAGKAVLLVDDIRTSGATLRAAAAALLAAGAASVDAAVAAR